MDEDEYQALEAGGTATDRFRAWDRFVADYRRLNGDVRDGKLPYPPDPHVVRGAIDEAGSNPDFEVSDRRVAFLDQFGVDVELARRVVMAAAMAENRSSPGVIDASVLACVFRAERALLVLEDGERAGQYKCWVQPTLGWRPSGSYEDARARFDDVLDELDALMILRASAGQMPGGALADAPATGARVLSQVEEEDREVTLPEMAEAFGISQRELRRWRDGLRKAGRKDYPELYAPVDPKQRSCPPTYSLARARRAFAEYLPACGR
jgi:hypothetical protein